MKMVDFISTEHSPPIFYRPKADNPESEARRKASQDRIMGKDMHGYSLSNF